MYSKMLKLIGIFLALTASIMAQNDVVSYDTISKNAAITFVYPDTLNNLYLRQLRNENNLTQLIGGFTDDKRKVLAILDWTNSQWKHNGNNEPSKNDANTILKEAKEGKQFRCVEYGIVSSHALLSVGYKARVLGLKTKDVETTESGAGHVLAEVWMPEFNKWALIDGQYNIMPTLNDIPLNAVEFRNAITQKKDFKLVDIKGEVSKRQKKKYLYFIYDYLYYLDTKFDKRMVSELELKSLEGKTSLFLVPIGAKNPTIFQIKFKIDNAFYTNSVKDFYQEPLYHSFPKL